MSGWSIKIVPAKNQKPGVLAEFIADAPDAEPGTFDVETGDLVSWDNECSEPHWPWPVEAETAPPVDPLPSALSPLVPGSVAPSKSSDDYSVTAKTGTIWYCCKLHPAERASLKIVPFGQPPKPRPSV